MTTFFGFSDERNRSIADKGSPWEERLKKGPKPKENDKIR